MFLFGIIYALPNLSPPDPAVQVSLQSAGDSFDTRLVQSVKNIARNEGILDENIEVNQKSLLIRTDSYEEQIKLKDELRRELGPDYVVALNLAYLVTGVIVVEVYFGYSGLATLIVQGVQTRDFILIQALGMIFCCTYVILMIIADVAAIVSNPRLRHPK